MEINEEKRNKFMEYAGKRVNNVLHDMQILEPMARSNSYDFTKEDVEEMFGAMQSTLNDVRAEFNKKFEEKARNEKKVFSFGNTKVVAEKVEDEVIDLDKKNREAKLNGDNLRSERKRLSDEIGKLMKAGQKEEAGKIRQEVQSVNSAIEENEELEEKYKILMKLLMER